MPYRLNSPVGEVDVARGAMEALDSSVIGATTTVCAIFWSLSTTARCRS
jgi:hypothetical protein